MRQNCSYTSPPPARHYNSALSIWLSVDPMADKYPSTSPYTYCANNPVRLVDPDGRFPIPWPSSGVWTISAKLKLGVGINYGLSGGLIGGISLDRHGMTHWTGYSTKYFVNQNLQEGSSHPAIELGLDLSFSLSIEHSSNADSFIKAMNSQSYSISFNGKCLVGGGVILGDDTYGGSVGIGINIGASSDYYQLFESISLSKEEAKSAGYSSSWTVISTSYSPENNTYTGYVQSDGKKTNIVVKCDATTINGSMQPSGEWVSEKYLQ